MAGRILKSVGGLALSSSMAVAVFMVQSPVSSQTASCDGRIVTVDLGAGQSPTPGDDVILGTPGPDVINGLEGDDVICALGGDDRVTGGPGADIILAGGGADQIAGNSGDDRLLGQGGRDTAFGGSGDDVVDGGVGDDLSLGGGSGRDTVLGGDGDDRLSGGSDADGLVDGGPGDDAVNGGGGNDGMVHGGGGDDTVSGNGGNDTVNGDWGDDEVRGGNGRDRVNGGHGDDLVAGGQLDDVCDGGPFITGDTVLANCETTLAVNARITGSVTLDGAPVNSFAIHRYRQSSSGGRGSLAETTFTGPDGGYAFNTGVGCWTLVAVASPGANFSGTAITQQTVCVTGGQTRTAVDFAQQTGVATANMDPILLAGLEPDPDPDLAPGNSGDSSPTNVDPYTNPTGGSLANLCVAQHLSAAVVHDVAGEGIGAGPPGAGAPQGDRGRTSVESGWYVVWSQDPLEDLQAHRIVVRGFAPLRQRVPELRSVAIWIPEGEADADLYLRVQNATGDTDYDCTETTNGLDHIIGQGPIPNFQCTHLGTAGSDVINGTESADRICAMNGSDVARGYGGHDVIYGRGPGSNVFDGGADRDAIDGGDGSDTLNGGPGIDFISGRGGHDVISGGGDSDVLVGGPGDDLVDGGEGGIDRTATYTDAANLDFASGKGDDRYHMGAGLHYVYENAPGADGDDVIIMGPGQAWAFGGPGNDVIQAAPEPFGEIYPGDQLYGGSGNDLLFHVTPFESFGPLTHGFGTPNLIGGPGNDLVMALDYSTDDPWSGDEPGEYGFGLGYGPCTVEWNPNNQPPTGSMSCGGFRYRSVDLSIGVTIDADGDLAFEATPEELELLITQVQNLQAVIDGIQAIDGGLANIGAEMCVCDPTMFAPGPGNTQVIYFTDELIR